MTEKHSSAEDQTEGRNPHNKQDLKECAVKVWENITAEMQRVGWCLWVQNLRHLLTLKTFAQMIQSQDSI